MKWTLLLALLAACSAAVRAPAPPPAAPSASPVAPSPVVRREPAVDLATRHGAELAAAVASQALVVQAALARLAAWDAAGDEGAALVEDFWPLLAQRAELAVLAAACAELATIATETAAPAPCGLAVRARDVIERQYLATARRAFGFSPLLREVPDRYRRDGRVAWANLLFFSRLEAELAKRSQELAPLAKAVGLPLVGEVFSDGFTARRRLQEEIRRALPTLELPLVATDTAFTRAVAEQLPAVAGAGPFPGERGTLLRVTAVDAAWSERVVAGGPLWRERRGAALWQPARPPCLVTWLRAVQEATGHLRWGPLRLSFEDDVRFVRCPRRGAAPGQSPHSPSGSPDLPGKRQNL